MKGLPKGVVKLYTNPPGNVLLDSCEVKDGKYFLEGKIMEPQAGLLFFDMEPQYQRLGLDGGYIYRAGGYEGV